MTISLQAQNRMVADRVSSTMPGSSTQSSHCKSGIGAGYCNVISPTPATGIAACPCCQRQLDEARETVGDIRMPSTSWDSLFKDDDSETDSTEDWDEQDHMMPGILSDGVAYCVKKVLVQGWVHKKGTGSDWFGSRAWKPRWAVLALVTIAGHDAQIPVLQIYWYSTSPSPTTVIHLDSAVVLPEDDSDESKWNKCRFKIQHVKKAVDETSVQVSRIFSCPKEGRDAWVYAINQALLGYEKEKAKLREHNRNMTLSPTRQRMSWAAPEAFPSKTMGGPAPTPPSSPNSRPFRYVTEPDIGMPLLGEALLGPDDE